MRVPVADSCSSTTSIDRTIDLDQRSTWQLTAAEQRAVAVGPLAPCTHPSCVSTVSFIDRRHHCRRRALLTPTATTADLAAAAAVRRVAARRVRSRDVPRTYVTRVASAVCREPLGDCLNACDPYRRMAVGCRSGLPPEDGRQLEQCIVTCFVHVRSI